MSDDQLQDNKNRVRFCDELVDSVHEASHDIEDDDHEILIWYSKVELEDIEDENDFLIDNKAMLQQSSKKDSMCWRGIEEKAIRLPVIQLVLEVWEEQKQTKQQNGTWDWEKLRSVYEEEGLAAKEKAQLLAQKDWMEAYQKENAQEEEKDQ